MDLHELPRESLKAGNSEGVCQAETERKDPLFPVPSELPDDVLDVILGNRKIWLKTGFVTKPQK